MKIVFVSNYFNHHQQPFSDAMYEFIGDEYTFIETSEMREERKKMGYMIDKFPPYVKQLRENSPDSFGLLRLIDDADVVIAGSASEKILKNRKKNNKLLIRYQERIFGQNLSLRQIVQRAIAWKIRNFKNKQIYLLCASAYTAADYNRLGAFENKSYKWGYFPQVKHYDITSLLSQKDIKKILWCGRFLPWKHPEYALEVANRLKIEGYSFSLDYIGSGELENKLIRSCEQMGLDNNVSFLGYMKPERVREYMEKSAIFMFTSNSAEGWGAVLNEAMNSGCAVVASHAVGSVPFLLKHTQNGLVFKSECVDDLYQRIKYLLDNPEERARLGANAYRTIHDIWNPHIAAERFLKFAEQIQKNGICDMFDDGPCSKAGILNEDWFGESN